MYLDADNWFLQLETFDPHEPFFAPERFKEKIKTKYRGPRLDWPQYERVTETDEEVQELNRQICALENEGAFGGKPIVTQVIDSGPTFWRAEDYHQDYYQNNFLRYLAYKSGCQREEKLNRIWK